MEQHYIEALKTDNNTVIQELYYANRITFLVFIKRYQISEEDGIDIYQEAFISLRKHAISGKLNEVQCSLKTYLFGIGKNLAYKKIKENAVKTNYDSKLHLVELDYEEIEVESESELTKEQKALQYYFKKLGKSCQQMLTLSFFRGLTNEEIASLEGYESESVVRSQKSRCLKKIKELIKNSKN